MNIQKESVVQINYTLKDNNGLIIDTSDGQEPLAYIHGIGNLIPGLEKELEGRAQGESLSVTIQPEDAYGKRNDEFVKDVPLNSFEDPTVVKEGVQFQVENEHGMGIATVVKIEEETVTVDMNHPLADVELNFDVEIISIREATDEELSHGHVHGEGGHHH